MRAAQYYGNRDIRVEEVADPETGPEQVTIDVEAAGICGTDLHEYAAGPILTPSEQPHVVTGETIPVGLGHEMSGVVSDVGAGVPDLEAGQRVTVNPMLPCGECRYCDEGKYNVCEHLGFVGLSGNGGGFAEQVTVPARNVVPLPSSVPLEAGALVEPLTVGLHAVRRSPMDAGDSVAVFGSGPIGLAIVQAARAAGAGKIFVSEPNRKRRERSAVVGADRPIDPTDEDPVEVIRSETGSGVEVAFEVAGVEPSYDQALRSTVHDGHLTLVGIYEEPVSFDPNEVVLVERTVGGANAFLGGPLSKREFEMTVSMLDRGELRADPLVTRCIGLDDVVDGFESLLERDNDDVKVLVEP
ncbi:2,3-butanediol dehydrogenase [Halomicroarcula sp. GCM10025817]|uniref:2,3-butanediol dehydrogenase n=2 Tax=Haloarcula TaxID=2237 RepID=UPI0036098D18